MNPLALLAWWREILIGVLVLAIGVQSYRLQGAQGARDILALEKTERIRRDGMRDMNNLKNRERTNEEYASARRRAAAVVVRGDTTFRINPGKPIELARGGDDATVCLDRGRLESELAGWLERHAAGLGAAATAVARFGNDRFTGVARAGEGVAAAYRSCRAWALNLQ